MSLSEAWQWCDQHIYFKSAYKVARVTCDQTVPEMCENICSYSYYMNTERERGGDWILFSKQAFIFVSVHVCVAVIKFNNPTSSCSDKFKRVLSIPFPVSNFVIFFFLCCTYMAKPHYRRQLKYHNLHQNVSCSCFNAGELDV